MLGSCGNGGGINAGRGGGTGSTASIGDWPSWDGGSRSVLSHDPPGFLRMYIR